MNGSEHSPMRRPQTGLINLRPVEHASKQVLSLLIALDRPQFPEEQRPEERLWNDLPFFGRSECGLLEALNSLGMARTGSGLVRRSLPWYFILVLSHRLVSIAHRMYREAAIV